MQRTPSLDIRAAVHAPKAQESCGTYSYQTQESPSGVVSFNDTSDLDPFSGLVAIHCDAVDELSRDGEEIGRPSATFLVGSPDEATQVAHVTEMGELEGGTETALQSRDDLEANLQDSTPEI